MTTDREILDLARRINACQLKILDLMDEIEESGHPNAQAIHDAIEQNIFVYASAVHCA